MPVKRGILDVTKLLVPEADAQQVETASAFLVGRPDLWHALTREERAQIARAPGELPRKAIRLIRGAWDRRSRGHRSHGCPECGRATMYPVESKRAGDDVEWLERCDSCGREESKV